MKSGNFPSFSLSAAIGTSLANYSITYVNGALSVTAKALTITASSAAKTYGDTTTFAGTEFTTAGEAQEPGRAGADGRVNMTS